MKIKKLVAIVSAVVLSLGTVTTAFAADSETGGTTSEAVKEAYVTKTYNDAVGHAATFKFNITQSTAEGAAELTISDISYNGEDKGGNKASELAFGEFTKAGTFEYTVTEDRTGAINSEHEKFIMSKAEYKVSVSVVKNADGAYVIDSIVVNKTKTDAGKTADDKVDPNKPGEGEANGFNFVNTYTKEAGTEPDDPHTYDEDGSLKVTKTVVNKEGDHNNYSNVEFQFTAEFTYPDGTDASTFGFATTGVTYTNGSFKLKNGESLKFTGLPVGTIVKIVEKDSGEMVASASVTMNGVEGTIAAGSKGAGVTAENKELGVKTNKVDVTNTSTYTPPTGIILNLLPYALMLAIAGAAMFLFFGFKRKRA